MGIYDEMAADAAEVFSEFGKEITWNGRTLAALISESGFSQELGIGGFSESGDFTAKLLRQALGESVPKHGDLISFAGQTFRVTRVVDRPPHPLIILTLSPRDE